MKEIIKNAIDQMIPMHRFLGISLEDISEGYALLRLPFREELVGDPRLMRLHGGVIALLLDSASGAAGLTTFTSPEDQMATIDIRIDYLAPGKAEDLYAEARIIRNGNQTLVTQMKAFHKGNPEVLAEGRGVYAIKRVGNQKFEL